MKKFNKWLLLMLLFALMLVGCSKGGGDKKEENNDKPDEINIIEDKYRSFYEVFVYSFYDSNGDGIGDLQGLIQKLDYINDNDPQTETDLGCNGIWLMPVNPSTTYHKYDITDYYGIDPEYGTVDDFKQLLEECHKRNTTLIMDFVMNHTSTQHEWFVQAKEYLASLGPDEEPDASKCKYVKYYNFEKGKPITGVYSKVEGTVDWFYECKFWSGMPDLALKNPDVRAEFEDIAKYWLDMGVDGFRLDAAKEYESDNDPENVEILKWFNDYVKSCKSDAYIVAEVYSGIGQYAKYLESGIDSVFDFDMATSTGYVAQTINGMLSDTAAANFGKRLQATIDTEKGYNANYIMAPFIGNHDVDRITPGYGYDANKIKIAIGMLHMMNGSSFLYYGDEVGLGGSGKDENKRAPMPWSSTATTGICKGPYHMEQDLVVNKFASVEDQIKDPESIFNFTRKVVALRNTYPEIARGDLELIETDNVNVLVMKKTYNDSSVIIAINTTKKDQTVNVSQKDNGFSSIRKLVAASSTAEATLDGDSLTLPSFSIAILK